MLMRRLFYRHKKAPHRRGREVLLHGLDLIEAFVANAFALEADKVVRVITEETGGMVLFQDDGLFVHKDFDGVLDVDAKRSAQFDRDNDPTEGVHFPNNTRRFHVAILSITVIAEGRLNLPHIINNTHISCKQSI